MANARTGGGGAGGGTPPATVTRGGRTYTKWSDGQKWAYFEKPVLSRDPSGRIGYGKTGWVRVGGSEWNLIQKANAGIRSASHSFEGAAGLKPNIPTRKTTGAWNPVLNRGKSALGTGVHGTGPKPNGGKQPGDPGYVAPGKGPNDAQNPGLHPPKTPPGNGPDFSKLLGNPNVGQMESMGDANTMAGLQFDSQINDARTQLADQHAQGAQNLADIAHWYTQMQNQNAAGGAANQAAVQRSAGAQGNVTQQLLAAIGGGANDSAGAVAAQGAGAQADMQQQGILQKLFQSNMSGALSSEQAGQQSAQSALNSQAEQSLGTQIRNLLGQRGQAVVQNQQAIRAANNSVANQNYANSISKLEAAVGARTALGNLKLQGLQLQQAQQQAGVGSNPSFVSQTPAQKVATMNLLTANPGGSGPVSMSVALQRAKVMGYDPVTVGHYLSAFYGTN